MNLRSVDLNLLVALQALLADRNVTNAARRIGLSQPGLSAQLAQLRRLFDDPLLVTHGRRMVQTARAKELEEPLNRLLAEISALLDPPAPFDPRTARATFRIAIPDAVQLSLGTLVVAHLAKAAPLHRMAMQRVEFSKLDAQLASGELDLAIVTSAALSPRLNSRLLMTENFVCMMRMDHPAAGTPLDINRFCALDHLLVSTDGGGFAGVIDDILGKQGRARRVSLSVENFLIVPHILEHTDLIATLPGRLLNAFADRRMVRALPFEVGFTLHLAWHSRADGDRAQQWLRDQVALIGKRIWET